MTLDCQRNLSQRFWIPIAIVVRCEWVDLGFNTASQQELQLRSFRPMLCNFACCFSPTNLIDIVCYSPRIFARLGDRNELANRVRERGSYELVDLV
jgi:hypothetical protein